MVLMLANGFRRRILLRWRGPLILLFHGLSSL